MSIVAPVIASGSTIPGGVVHMSVHTGSRISLPHGAVSGLSECHQVAQASEATGVDVLELASRRDLHGTIRRGGAASDPLGGPVGGTPEL
jgi:hypothetical protein